MDPVFDNDIERHLQVLSLISAQLGDEIQELKLSSIRSSTKLPPSKIKALCQFYVDIGLLQSEDNKLFGMTSTLTTILSGDDNFRRTELIKTFVSCGAMSPSSLPDVVETVPAAQNIGDTIASPVESKMDDPVAPSYTDNATLPDVSTTVAPEERIVEAPQIRKPPSDVESVDNPVDVVDDVSTAQNIGDTIASPVESKMDDPVAPSYTDNATLPDVSTTVAPEEQVVEAPQIRKPPSDVESVDTPVEVSDFPSTRRRKSRVANMDLADDFEKAEDLVNALRSGQSVKDKEPAPDSPSVGSPEVESVDDELPTRRRKSRVVNTDLADDFEGSIDSGSRGQSSGMRRGRKSSTRRQPTSQPDDSSPKRTTSRRSSRGASSQESTTPRRRTPNRIFNLDGDDTRSNASSASSRRQRARDQKHGQRQGLSINSDRSTENQSRPNIQFNINIQPDSMSQQKFDQLSAALNKMLDNYDDNDDLRSQLSTLMQVFALNENDLEINSNDETD